MKTTVKMNAFDQSTWCEEERFYFDYVKKHLKEGNNERISNGRPLHAVFLIESLLSHAKESIRIFSGSLAQKSTIAIDTGLLVYSEPKVIDAALKFLSRNSQCTLDIILEKDIDLDNGQHINDHPLIAAITNLKKDNKLKGTLTVRKASSAVLKALRKYDYCQHMLVMDKKAYRLETDPDTAKAYVNFGDKKIASSLATLFDKILLPHSNQLIKITG